MQRTHVRLIMLFTLGLSLPLLAGPPRGGRGNTAGLATEWNNILGGAWETATNWIPTDVPDSAGESASIAELQIQTTIDQTAGGELLADAGIIAYPSSTSSAVLGGSLTSLNDGVHVRASSGTTTLTDVTNEARFNILGGGALAVAGAGLENNGLIIVNSNGSATVLEGTGTVSGTVTNEGGSVAPGESVGTLTMTTYSQQPQGRVTVEVGGTAPGQFDVLNVTGTATLFGGTLEIVLIDGYLPAPGDTVQVMNFASLSGAFSSVSGLCAGNGQVWQLNYGAASLTLEAAATACPISIISSDPANFVIDARQPTNVDGTGVFGFDQIDITFDGDTAGLTPADFTVSVTGGTAPAIVSATSNGNVATLELDVPIPPGEWTTFVHNASQTRSTLGYLPGDVNGDGTSAAPDLLSLIDFLNGVTVLPIHSTDIDRTGLSAPQDVLRLIDLLNGAGAFDLWLGVALPPPPGP